MATQKNRSVTSVALERAFFFRHVPTLFEVVSPDPGQATDLGVEQPSAIIWDSTLATPAGFTYDVSGRLYHVVQVTNLNGGDAIQISGSLDGVTFTPLTTAMILSGVAVNNLVANGIYEFTGIFKALKATRTGGTGTTTQALLASIAP
jgi:hypothetical protein